MTMTCWGFRLRARVARLLAAATARRRSSAVLLGLLAFLLVGCGEARERVAANGDPAGPPAPGPAAVRLVEAQDADMVLWVSNQSFVDDPVAIRVRVDGVEVVDREFAVEGQHTWVAFPLALPPGEHVVTATSGTGAQLRREFRTPGRGMRYAAINYWNYEDGDGRHFDWRFSDERIAFD